MQQQITVQTPLLLSAEDLAAMLRVSRPTIWRLRAAGKLPRPSAALGKQVVRWNAEEIRQWVAAGMPTVEQWEAIKTKNGMAGPGNDATSLADLAP